MKEFLTDLLKYLPSIILPGFIGFVSVPIITRLFPPSDYGNYSLVLATVLVMTTINGWLSMSIIRFYPIYERDLKLDFFYGNIIRLLCFSLSAITLLCFVFLVLTKSIISAKLLGLLLIGLCVFVFTSSFDVFQHFLRAKKRVGLYSTFSVVKSIGGLSIGLLFVFFIKKDISYLLWGMVFGAAIILPIVIKKAIGNLSILKYKLNPNFIREMTKYSMPLVFGNLAAWILSLSDRYIIEIFRDSREMGIYSASYNISDHSLFLLVSLFWLASRPISMHLWEKKAEDESRKFLNQVTRYYLIVCIPAVIGMVILEKPIIAILVDIQYFEGYKIVPFVVLGVFFLGLQQIFQTGILYYKKTIFITYAIVAAGILNIILNILFIAKYGYIAAAVTTLISYCFLFIIIVILSRHFFVWKFPFKSLEKSIFSAGAMGIVLHLTKGEISNLAILDLILNVLLGCFLYFILLFLIKEFTSEEKATMKKFLYGLFKFKLEPN